MGAANLFYKLMHLIRKVLGIKRYSKPVPDLLFPMPQITNDTCYQQITHIKQINYCRRTSSGKYTRRSQTLHKKLNHSGI